MWKIIGGLGTALLGAAKTAATMALEIAAIFFIISTVAAWLISLLAMLVDYAIGLGNNIINLTAVHEGWKIVLGFTNLGFVLGIIIIAFATILRLETYGMKQILWKLIVAALLVNFSLVIAGAFISVSKIATDSFYNSITENGQKSISDVLGEIVQLGRLTEPPSISIIQSIVGGFETGIKFIIGNLAVLISQFLIILAFATLFVMLLMRAIALIFLLILSPIVWLLWIFPDTKKYWQQWWQEFIRWNFFAPAVMFFISLGITISKNLGELGDISKTTVGTTLKQNTLAGENILQYIANLFVIIAFLVGGLYVSNKFGIAGGGIGIKMAQGAGKWFGGAVKGAGKAAGRKTYEGTVGKALGSKKVEGWTEKLSGSKFVGARLLGQGLNRLGAKSEKYLQADYEKLAKEFSPDRLMNEILASRGTKRAVLLREAAKRKDIDLKKLAPVLNNPEELERIEKDFARAGLNIKDLWKAIGKNSKMIKAAAAGDDNALRLATDEFVKSLTPKDYAKGQWDAIFKDDSPIGQKIQKQLAGSFAMFEPGAYAKIAPQLKGEALDKFADVMNKKINLYNEAIEKGHFEALLKKWGYSDEEIPGIKTRVAKAKKALDKTLSRRFMYGEEQTSPPKEEA